MAQLIYDKNAIEYQKMDSLDTVGSVGTGLIDGVLSGMDSGIGGMLTGAFTGALGAMTDNTDSLKQTAQRNALQDYEASKRMISSENKEFIGNDEKVTPYYALGGKIKNTRDVGGRSLGFKVKGHSHKQGGVNYKGVELEGGEFVKDGKYVFSKNINGIKFAEIANGLNKKKRKQLYKLENGDNYAKNTAMKTINDIEQQYEKLFAIQGEMNGGNTGKSYFKTGGSIPDNIPDNNPTDVPKPKYNRKGNADDPTDKTFYGRYAESPNDTPEQKQNKAHIRVTIRQDSFNKKQYDIDSKKYNDAIIKKAKTDKYNEYVKNNFDKNTKTRQDDLVAAGYKVNANGVMNKSTATAQKQYGIDLQASKVDSKGITLPENNYTINDTDIPKPYQIKSSTSIPFVNNNSSSNKNNSQENIVSLNNQSIFDTPYVSNITPNNNPTSDNNPTGINPNDNAYVAPMATTKPITKSKTKPFTPSININSEYTDDELADNSWGTTDSWGTSTNITKAKNITYDEYKAGMESSNTPYISKKDWEKENRINAKMDKDIAKGKFDDVGGDDKAYREAVAANTNTNNSNNSNKINNSVDVGELASIGVSTLSNILTRNKENNVTIPKRNILPRRQNNFTYDISANLQQSANTYKQYENFVDSNTSNSNVARATLGNAYAKKLLIDNQSYQVKNNAESTMNAKVQESNYRASLKDNENQYLNQVDSYNKEISHIDKGNEIVQNTIDQFTNYSTNRKLENYQTEQKGIIAGMGGEYNTGNDALYMSGNFNTLNNTNYKDELNRIKSNPALYNKVLEEVKRRGWIN